MGKPILGSSDFVNQLVESLGVEENWKEVTIHITYNGLVEVTATYYPDDPTEKEADEVLRYDPA